MGRVHFTIGAVFFCASIAHAGAMWTETFNESVGSFDITPGEGESVFVHDSVNGNLHATFIRRDASQTTIPDRRLASLDRTYSNSDVTSFSVEWTPISHSGNFAWPLIGFFKLNDLNDIAVFRIANNDTDHRYRVSLNWDSDPSLVIDPGFPDWQWGETYLLELALDGPNQQITFSTSILQDGEYQLQGLHTSRIPDELSYEFDMLGIGNIIDNQFINSSFTSSLDNFSFAPEPSTAALLGLVALPLLSRRRLQTSS